MENEFRKLESPAIYRPETFKNLIISILCFACVCTCIFMYVNGEGCFKREKELDKLLKEDEEDDDFNDV